MDLAFLIDILIGYGKLFAPLEKLINLLFHEFKNQPKLYLSVLFVFMILSKAFFHDVIILVS